MTVIVGAGLAGLSCALELFRTGRPFLLLEAAACVGGRQRTTRRDGFLLDQGFQVILSSYAAVAEVVDIAALQPCWFQSGALLHHDGRFDHLVSPFENPLGGLTTPAISWADTLRLGLLGAEVLASPDQTLLSRCRSPRDVSTRTFLGQRGFSASFMNRFAQPFFGGVLLDNDLESSAGLFLYYLKKFVTGRAWIPAGGIQALPQAMADQIPRASLRTNACVASLSPNSVTLENGETIPADHIVLALDKHSLCKLLDRPAPPAPRSVAVVYFKTRTSLYKNPCLVLLEGSNRCVRHLVQITNIAPGFAPPGWHLVSATILNPSRFTPDRLVAEAARETTAVFPHATGTLSHVDTFEVPCALPPQPPGFASENPFPNLPHHLSVCGDWACGASIQAALTSGMVAARQIPH